MRRNGYEFCDCHRNVVLGSDLRRVSEKRQMIFDGYEFWRYLSEGVKG